MKILLFIVIASLLSCHDPNYETASVFKQYIPDTSNTWAGQRTKEAMIQSGKFQARFRLDSIDQGTIGKEIRIWQFSSSYDPQILQLIKKLPDGSCTLRIISFMREKDTVLQDLKRNLKPGITDSIDVTQLWALQSQSDLPDGDSYACKDGSDLYIELADAERYKILWYRCPEINGKRNSTFEKAFALTRFFANNIVL